MPRPGRSSALTMRWFCSSLATDLEYASSPLQILKASLESSATLKNMLLYTYTACCASHPGKGAIRPSEMASAILRHDSANSVITLYSRRARMILSLRLPTCKARMDWISSFHSRGAPSSSAPCSEESACCARNRSYDCEGSPWEAVVSEEAEAEWPSRLAGLGTFHWGTCIDPCSRPCEYNHASMSSGLASLPSWAEGSVGAARARSLDSPQRAAHALRREGEAASSTEKSSCEWWCFAAGAGSKWLRLLLLT
mmetsp:Transcript_9560/g.21176  ORF Transcript_9560/g.21176 Transcript_9560/m.21176 type:complete len:254 (-) Transcript_9560:394-1155(-)